MTNSHNQAIEEAPPHIQDECNAIRELLLRRSGEAYPHFVEAAPDSFENCERYAFEIASNLLLQIVREHDCPTADFATKAVESAVEAVRQAKGLAGGARKMAQSVEQAVGRARLAGLPVQMHRLDIAERDDWADSDKPSYLAGLLTLGDNLRPTLEWLTVDSHADLKRQFRASMSDLRIRHATQSKLRPLNADGMIDVLALGLVLDDPDPASVFERLHRSDRLHLAGGGSLFWNDGCISSNYVSTKDGYGWQADRFWIHGRHIPETLCVHLEGKPASLLIDLPALTKGVTILEITNRHCADHPFAEALLDLPNHLVNTVEHRHWAA